MMLAKPEGKDSASTMEASSSNNDREKDLERRLASLGGHGHSGTTIATENANVNEERQPVEGKSAMGGISFDGLTISGSSQPASSSSSAPTAVKPNKNALLAKIMAAQERAKQAQMKQTTPTSPIEQKSTTILPAPTEMNMNTSSNTTDAFNGLADKTDSSFTPPVLPSSSTSLPPPPQFAVPPMSMAATTTKVAPMNNVNTTTQNTMNPQSFEMFEQQQKKETEEEAAFEQSLNMLGMEAAPVSAPPPTTTTTDDSVLSNFGIVAPVPPQPPTGTQIESETVPTTTTFAVDEGVLDDDNMFEFDIDGNKLSAEERRKLMEEQRAIMEQIKKQAVENKASEAAVRANAFETRMSETALTQNQFSAPPSTTTPVISNQSEDVDLSSIGAAQIEEQRAILEEIERQKAQRAAGGVTASVVVPTAPTGAYATPSTGAYHSPADIAPGRTQNTHIADSVREAIQMEEDRRLAEALQQEENQAAAAESTNRAAPEEETTWWDTIAGAMGATTTTTTEIDPNQRSAEISISRPPGSMTPSQRAMHGGNSNVERQSLLSSSGTGSATSRPAARVAESKPLFSCIADSVTMAATAASVAAAGASSMVYGDEDEEHGVDTTSFLNVPGEDRDSPSGNYAQL